MSRDDRWSEQFAGRRCLITGGLGFIGSTLAMRLVDLGAHVSIVDAMSPEYGGNLFNLGPMLHRDHSWTRPARPGAMRAA
jgi:UDP-glucose 4-epimerase